MTVVISIENKFIQILTKSNHYTLQEKKNIFNVDRK